MEINWFQIVAQIINFFILLFLLNKLLYIPVTRAMTDRQEKLAADKMEAEQIRRQADEQAAKYEEHMAKIEETKQDMIAEARKEASAQYDQLLAKYRSEAEDKRAVFVSEVEREQGDFLRELRGALGESAVMLASEMLQSLAAEDLEERIFEMFLRQISSIDLAELKEEGAGRDDRATMLSHTELDGDKKKTVEKNLQSVLGFLPHVSYEVDDGLLLGYQLHFATLTVQKSMRRYLDETEKNIRAQLEKMK